MAVLGKLLLKVGQLTDAQLRELQSHVATLIALKNIGHAPGRLEYTTDQWDFLAAVAKASSILRTERQHYGDIVARKAGRKSCLKAYQAVQLVIRKFEKGELTRKQKIVVYEMLAGWAADYREAREPVLDPRHAQQLLLDVKEVIAGTRPRHALSAWVGILNTRVYRRQTSPQAIIRELMSPMTILSWCFPGYIKADALGLVFSNIMARGGKRATHHR